MTPPEYICRACHRVVDAILEPTPGEPTRCPDCTDKAEREFSEWLRDGWSA